MLTWTLKPWQRALIARLDVPKGLIERSGRARSSLEHAIVSNRMSGVSSQNAHPQHREAFGAILANVRKAVRRAQHADGACSSAAASPTAAISKTASR